MTDFDWEKWVPSPYRIHGSIWVTHAGWYRINDEEPIYLDAGGTLEFDGLTEAPDIHYSPTPIGHELGHSEG